MFVFIGLVVVFVDFLIGVDVLVCLVMLVGLEGWAALVDLVSGVLGFCIMVSWNVCSYLSFSNKKIMSK